MKFGDERYVEYIETAQDWLDVSSPASEITIKGTHGVCSALLAAHARVEELVTALEFYGDVDNWRLARQSAYRDNYFAVCTEDDADTLDEAQPNSSQKGSWVAGKRARLALEKWRKE